MRCGIGLRPQELAQMHRRLESLLPYLERLEAADGLPHGAPREAPLSASGTLEADDRPRPCPAPDLVVANAPVLRDGCFEVPGLRRDSGGEE